MMEVDGGRRLDKTAGKEFCGAVRITFSPFLAKRR